MYMTDSPTCLIGCPRLIPATHSELLSTGCANSPQRRWPKNGLPDSPGAYMHTIPHRKPAHFRRFIMASDIEFNSDGSIGSTLNGT